jgi:DNA-binding NarL/FixJ family response regulator
MIWDASLQNPPVKVLLIDDHPLILSALKTAISGLEEGVSVVDVADAQSARDVLLQDSDFDLVLLDLRLGEDDGFEVLSEFRTAYPALPVVVVSASDRTSDVIRSIDLGAMGFVPKRSSNDTLFEALRMVLCGGIYVPQMNLGAAHDPSGRFGVGEPAAPRLMPVASATLAKASPLEALDLTPRQNEVLALLLQGKPNKLIARDLKLSVETVKDHVAAVLRALNVSSRTQAVLAMSELTRGQDNGPGRRKTDP